MRVVGCFYFTCLWQLNLYTLAALPLCQVCAIMGLVVVPLSYATVWELVHSNMASFIAGLLMACETGTLILSQYILLDPPLLCFVMLSTFCTARFINCRKEYVLLSYCAYLMSGHLLTCILVFLFMYIRRSFDLEWWYWLSLSGMFIGCAFRWTKTLHNILLWLAHFLYVHSVKWVGLFVIALVGLTTIKDLWDLLGDLSLTMVSCQKRLMLEWNGDVVCGYTHTISHGML